MYSGVLMADIFWYSWADSETENDIDTKLTSKSKIFIWWILMDPKEMLPFALA